MIPFLCSCSFWVEEENNQVRVVVAVVLPCALGQKHAVSWWYWYPYPRKQKKPHISSPIQVRLCVWMSWMDRRTWWRYSAIRDFRFHGSFSSLNYSRKETPWAMLEKRCTRANVKMGHPVVLALYRRSVARGSRRMAVVVMV